MKFLYYIALFAPITSALIARDDNDNAPKGELIVRNSQTSCRKREINEIQLDHEFGYVVGFDDEGCGDRKPTILEASGPGKKNTAGKCVDITTFDSFEAYQPKSHQFVIPTTAR